MSPIVSTPLPKLRFPLARRQFRRFSAPALILLLSILALWPTAFNRGVLLFPDSLEIVHAGDAAIVKVFPSVGASGFFKKLDALSVRDGEPTEQGGRRFGTAPPPTGRAAKVSSPVVIGGRSAYYGLAAEIAFRFGGFWIWALAQAAVGVGLLWLTCAHFGLSAASRSATILFAIALTSFPVYANLMLPDIWAGYTILSVCALSAFSQTMSRGETAFHLAVVAFACLSHNSIILMILAAGLASGVLQAVHLLRRRLRRGEREIATASATSRVRLPKAAIVCGLAVATGLAGSALYAHVVKSKIGVSTVTPPFMTARLVADGPGRRYLRRHCDGARFYICELQAPIPSNSDAFLWGGHGVQGVVWSRTSAEERKQLSEQDAKFALAVMLYDPTGVFTSAISNAVRQFSSIDFTDILSYSPSIQTGLAEIEPKYSSKIAKSRAFIGNWPKRTMEIAEMILMIMSYIGLMIINLRKSLWIGPIRKFANDALLMLVVNAAVCGCVSGVFGRYQGRVAWVLACVVFTGFLCAPPIRTWFALRRRSSVL